MCKFGISGDSSHSVATSATPRAAGWPQRPLYDSTVDNHTPVSILSTEVRHPVYLGGLHVMWLQRRDLGPGRAASSSTPFNSATGCLVDLSTAAPTSLSPNLKRTEIVTGSSRKLISSWLKRRKVRNLPALTVSWIREK